MNIAIVQMPMAWSVEENTETIKASIGRARELGAEVAVFPECATTGYTSKTISGAMSQFSVQQAIQQISTECAESGIAAVVGTPYFANDNTVWNAIVAIDEHGELLAVCPKNLLTKSEANTFQPGESRPVFTLGGVKCSAILCCEYNDIGLVRKQITEDVLVLFWPCVMSKDPDTPPARGSKPCNSGGCKMAGALNAFLVQANWPHFLDWDQNYMGLSAVISPFGHVVYECPADTPGIAVVTLDLSPGCESPVVLRAWDESVFSR